MDVVLDILNLVDKELYGIYVGVAEFPLKTLASKGSKASGLSPQPTNIY